MLPTWNGEVVSSPATEMPEILDEAPEVLRNALGGSLSRMGTRELLHAIEAAAWLNLFGESGQRAIAPAAKAGGASWADLAAAMGVSRSTAKYRYQQEAAEWEQHLKERNEPRKWETITPMDPVDLPTDFQPTDDDLARSTSLPTWVWIGELEPAIQFIRATHTDVKVWEDDGVHSVMSTSLVDGVTYNASSTADSLEEAWRAHIGSALGHGKPYPDDALPGETVIALKARIRQQR
ncbi:hypothetical protein [Promicromonospora sp. NPDC059942]|uniref:hypothetical protein n=1 Tax=Promicromonospora sp. NPDC059942 TaxID=3347009 RepID=UPI0036460683